MAIGIILSGTAKDGSQGLREIKAADGTTFTQTPQSSKFDGMPRNAVIEQSESVNEELRAANEEIQTSNEELHSMNEELETAKADP